MMANIQPAGETTANRRRKVSTRTKILFASGTLQEGCVTAAGITTVIFYNQVLGVSPSLVGTAFLIVSILDAITDPLIGTWSDQLQSAWGRRHPFMLASCIPIAVSFYFLYQPPEGLSEFALFAWLTAFLSFLRLGQTFYQVPHDALGAELTDDHEERTSVFGFDSVMGMVLGLVMSGLVLAVIFPTEEGGPNGLLNPAGYLIMAIAGIPTIFLSVLLCTLGTLDQVAFLQKIDSRKKFLVKDYLAELQLLLSNPSYVGACLSLLTLFIGLGVISVVAGYAYIYVFDFSSEDMFWAGVVKLPGVLVALPLLYFLSRRFEKRDIFIYISIFCAFLVSSPHILRLFDFFPANDASTILLAVYGPLFLAYLVMPVSFIVVDSQLADVADDHELRVGKRSEGIIFAVRSFGKKATMGIGGMLAGFGLEWINFPANAAEVGVGTETIDGLLILNGPVYFVCYLAGTMFMFLYRIDKKRHDQILSELELRRASEEEAVGTV